MGCRRRCFMLGLHVSWLLQKAIAQRRLKIRHKLAQRARVRFPGRHFLRRMFFFHRLSGRRWRLHARHEVKVTHQPRIGSRMRLNLSLALKFRCLRWSRKLVPQRRFEIRDEFL
jgi:hypothetical protein